MSNEKVLHIDSAGSKGSVTRNYGLYPSLYPSLPHLLDVLCETLSTTPSFIQALHLLFKPPLTGLIVFCLLSFNPSCTSQPGSLHKAILVSEALSKKTADDCSP